MPEVADKRYHARLQLSVQLARCPPAQCHDGLGTRFLHFGERILQGTREDGEQRGAFGSEAGGRRDRLSVQQTVQEVDDEQSDLLGGLGERSAPDSRLRDGQESEKERRKRGRGGGSFGLQSKRTLLDFQTF